MNRVDKSHRYNFLFIGMILSIGFFCHANKTEWNEIYNFKSYIPHMRAGKYQIVIQKIKNKKSPSYAESFLIGKTYFSLKQYKHSALWFANSVFENNNKLLRNPTSSIYEYLNSWGNIFKKDSPVITEALYYIALCYYRRDAPNLAIQILEIMEEHLTSETEEKYWHLKAKVYSKINTGRGIMIYKKLVDQYPKSTYYIEMASAYKRKKKYSKALDIYFKSLEFTKILWSSKIAAKEIIGLIKRKPTLGKSFKVRKKIFLAESYRLMNQKVKTNKIWKSIKIELLTPEDNFIYVKLYSRFLFTKLQYHKAVVFLKKYSNRLEMAQRDEIMFELSTKLLKKDRYQNILELIPAYFSNRNLILHRMQALRKLKISSREEEAKHYLKNHDADSTITERTYFSLCLEKIIAKKLNSAKLCLSDLAFHTIKVSTGGRSRYFLAKLSEANETPKSIQNNYAKVYLNSPSDMYTFKSLKKSTLDNEEPLPKNNIEEIRTWLANQAGKEESFKLFFDYKKNHPKYGIDPFWEKWESDLEKLDHANLKIKKAILFIVMYSNDLANLYMNKMKMSERLMIYQKAGHLINDPYLKYTHLKAYLIKNKKSVDIFTLSKKAQECLYPTPYAQYIQEASDRFGVESDRLYAIIKQESAFHPALKSSVGATGVMQVMPTTAKWLNKKLKIKKMNLTNPRHSILLGAKFYADASKRYSQNFEEIAIAYNAGPRRLINWKKTIPATDHDLFLEQIPFRETKLYVKRTKAYYDRYKILLNFASDSTKH